MYVDLTPELEKFVHGKINSGCYNSTSEVLCEALRLLEERDRTLKYHREEIQKKINEGLDSLGRGEVVDGEEVFTRLENELDAAEKKHNIA